MALRPFLLAVLCALLAVSARACSCLPNESLRTTACRAAISVLGTVVAKWDDCTGTTCTPLTSGFRRTTYVVRVLRTLRGTPPDDGVVLLTTLTLLCPATLQTGRVYVINGFSTSAQAVCVPGAPPTYEVTFCGFNTAFESVSAADQAFLFANPIDCAKISGTTVPVTTTATGGTTPTLVTTAATIATTATIAPTFPTTPTTAAPLPTVATTTQLVPVLPPDIPVLPPADFVPSLPGA